MTAIVGPTGAGKTTIINLLMRFYDADSGTITIDRSNIYGVTRKSLRLAYTMVLQDTWLFHGTVFENIAYGREDATMEKVVAATKAAKIHGADGQRLEHLQRAKAAFNHRTGDAAGFPDADSGRSDLKR